MRCEEALHPGDHVHSWTVAARDGSFAARFELCGGCDAVVEADRVAQDLLHLKARNHLRQILRMVGDGGGCGHA